MATSQVTPEHPAVLTLTQPVAHRPRMSLRTPQGSGSGVRSLCGMRNGEPEGGPRLGDRPDAGEDVLHAYQCGLMACQRGPGDSVTKHMTSVVEVAGVVHRGNHANISAYTRDE